MIEVDKTKIDINVHENIVDIIIDTNLVLASDLETIIEAFEEEDDLAVRETDQESREYGRESSLDPWWYKATSEMEDNHEDSSTA